MNTNPFDDELLIFIEHLKNVDDDIYIYVCVCVCVIYFYFILFIHVVYKWEKYTHDSCL